MIVTDQSVVPNARRGTVLSRRRFVRLTGVAGVGLIVAACSSPKPVAPTAPATAAAAPTPSRTAASPATATSVAVATAPATTAGQATPVVTVVLAPRRQPTNVDAYIHVASDGKIGLFTGKVEYGQGIQTGFAQLVAEELDVPFSSVAVTMGITDQTPWDLGTFGSLSTRLTGPVIRQAAAEMRQWLVELGATKLGVATSEVITKEGRVSSKRDPNKAVSYGELAVGKTINRTTRGNAPLKDPSTHTIVGQSIPRVDVPLKVNGEVKYGYDTTIPGMLHGKVVRPPSWSATLQGVDFSAAQQIPGVVGVFSDGNFAGLAAERLEQAETALALVKANWLEKAAPYTSENIFDALKATKDQGHSLGKTVGDVTRALGQATTKVAVTVRAPYVAHAQIEPMSALANVRPDKTEIWTSTQNPFAAQDAAAQVLNIPREQVIVYPMMSGGAFGRKNLTDAVVEAVRLSKALGRPVRVNWTRPEEFQFDHPRPAMLVELTAGIDDHGQLIAWDWSSYAAAYFDGETRPTSSGASDGGNVLDVYPAIPNARSMFYQSVAPLPPEHWRGNGAIINGLARETVVDELAELAKLNPVSFRDRLLVKNPRMAAVMHRAVEKAGWKPGVGSTGQGFGIALNFTDGTYIAEVAQVAVDKGTGQVRVKHVDAAVDCGLVVNPGAAACQVEGAIVMQGTSSTLNEQVLFDKGRVTNASFAQYNPLHFLEAPSVDVVFVEDKRLPMRGIGEPAVAPVSGAISNAIYDAVGIRPRDLPFLPNKILAALKGKGTS